MLQLRCRARGRMIVESAPPHPAAAGRGG